MTAQELMLKWAKVGIYFEIAPDCFAMVMEPELPAEDQVCWRPVYAWYQNGTWHNNDCGCSNDLEMILKVADSVAQRIFDKVYKGQPLDFKTVNKNSFSEDYWH